MRVPTTSRAVALTAAGVASLAIGGVLAVDSDTARSAFPGDNGLIVFSSDRTSGQEPPDFEIYSMRADGTDVRKLTDNGLAPASDEESEEGEGNGNGPPEGHGGPPDGMGGGEDDGEGAPLINDIHPAVAPDGKRIAFSSNRPAADGSTDPEIYVMDLDGANVVQVTDNRPGSGSGAEYEPAWSPDGTRIVFRRGDGTKADLVVKDLATGAETTLVIPPTTHGRRAYDGQPAWSPDGRKIAFRKGFGPATGVWVYDIATKLAVELADEADIAESQPSWSPDGSQIAYARGDDSAGAAIWVVNADGTNRHALTNPVAPAPFVVAGESGEGSVPMYSDHAPAWSPDGTRIAFQSTRNGLIKPPEVGTEHPSEEEGEGDHGGGMTPEHFDPGNIELYTMRADGSDQVRLTQDAAQDGPQDVTADWAAIPKPVPVVVPTVSGAPEVQVVAGSRSGGARSRVCASRRRFTIRLSKRVRQANVVKTALFVNGTPTAVRYANGRLRATVDLRGLPRGRYEVKAIIRVRTAITVRRNGRLVRTHRLVETRTYRTCVPPAA